MSATDLLDDCYPTSFVSNHDKISARLRVLSNDTLLDSVHQFRTSISHGQPPSLPAQPASAPVFIPKSSTPILPAATPPVQPIASPVPGSSTTYPSRSSAHTGWTNPAEYGEGGDPFDPFSPPRHPNALPHWENPLATGHRWCRPPAPQLLPHLARRPNLLRPRSGETVNERQAVVERSSQTIKDPRALRPPYQLT